MPALTLPLRRFGLSRFRRKARVAVNEFELIRQFFDRRLDQSDVIIGVGDDGAVLRPADGEDQVQVIDTLVEGVHFPSGTDAFDVGYRVVAVNVSDIAAMGARPQWMTLALTLSEAKETWLAAFSSGLFTAAEEYGVRLVGGDTTRGQSLVVTVAISGAIARNSAIPRTGARPGDAVFVSGTLGDAAAGLSLLQGSGQNSFLQRRFLRPTARTAIGQSLVGHATAMIDVSDGFVGDLEKLLNSSRVGAQIEIERLPLSTAMREQFNSCDAREFALYGGDDYELCFAASARAVKHIAGITEVGVVTAAEELILTFEGKVVPTAGSGYRHFT